MLPSSAMDSSLATDLLHQHDLSLAFHIVALDVHILLVLYSLSVLVAWRPCRHILRLHPRLCCQAISSPLSNIYQLHRFISNEYWTPYLWRLSAEIFIICPYCNILTSAQIWNWDPGRISKVKLWSCRGKACSYIALWLTCIENAIVNYSI